MRDISPTQSPSRSRLSASEADSKDQPSANKSQNCRSCCDASVVESAQQITTCYLLGQVGRHPIPRHCAAHTRSLSEATNSTPQGAYPAWGSFLWRHRDCCGSWPPGHIETSNPDWSGETRPRRIAANRCYAAETATGEGPSHEPMARTRRQPTCRSGDRDSQCRRFPGENRP